jgi:hypothetical protein
MGTGKVTVRRFDSDIEMFGIFKSQPHFIANVDFNSDHPEYDRIADKNGYMKDHLVRNETRLGWQGGA